MNFKTLLVVLITIAASPSMGQGPLAGSAVGTNGAPFQKDELKNGDGKQSTSLSARLGQPVSLAARVNQLEAEFREKIEEINTKTSRSSKDQDEKIAIIRVRERNLAQLLNTTREEMETLKTTNRGQSKRIDQLEQKLTMLQNTPPPKPLTRTTKDKMKNGASYDMDGRLSKSSTPPSSCQELSMLDYYLDGLYMVKNKTSKKIESVFCQFLADNKVTTFEMGTLVELEDPELEVKIMECLSNKLLPIDSKITEQTKQIQDIFGLLAKKQDDNSLLMESKKDSRGNPSQSATSTTPLTTALLTSVSRWKTTKSKTKKPSVISSSPDDRNCAVSSGRVECEKVPMENIPEFFQRTDLVTDNLFRSIKLNLLNENELIPANILGNKKTGELVIKYDDRQNPVALLEVDANAFQSTKNYTKTLLLSNFDSSQLDLGFLSGFNQLTSLSLEKVHHIQKSLPTLPLLPKLTSLDFNNVRGLNDAIITFPTLSTGGLKTFMFRFSGMHTDASVSRVLDWILLSSAETLETLLINSIGITEIPSQIPSLTALKDLKLVGNSISTIKKGALRFSVPVSKLRLWQNKINSIESGAFQGDFRDAEVNLRHNSLTRFDESVFKPILEQMVSGKGEIICHANRIDCSTENICHLAWLIRDNKLRPKVVGECSNGTTFSSLKENGFNHCPVTKKSK